MAQGPDHKISVSQANYFLACPDCVSTTFHIKQEGVEMSVQCEKCGKEVHSYE